LKKVYFYVEAFKLKRFESIVAKSDLMLVVSTEDEKHFKTIYPSNDVVYLPSFHQNDEVLVGEGISDYILYHGNLSVSENYMAANWLIENVFSGINHKVIIAGLNPPKFLKDKILKFTNISLKENCTREEMDSLIHNAQVHCLYTPQATGLKLKLLNVLFKGRFVIANNEMIHGTDLSDSCLIANSPDQYIEIINANFDLAFNHNLLQKRMDDLNQFQNSFNCDTLINFIKNKVMYTRIELADLILKRIEKDKELFKKEFQNSSQINSCIIDDLLPEHIALEIYKSFPEPNSMGEHRSIKENKK